MKNYTLKELTELGYVTMNMQITNASLNITDNGYLVFNLVCATSACNCNILGRYAIGQKRIVRETGEEEFIGGQNGISLIMQVMDIVGVDSFNKLVGSYVRIAVKDVKASVNIFGNIIEDKWFDAESFFGIEGENEVVAPEEEIIVEENAE